MKTKLHALRQRLHRLGGARRRLRAAIGLGAAIIAGVWTLGALFLADWLLAMTRPQRVVAMGIAVGCVAYAYRRWVRPWLAPRESETTLALLVERTHGIDSDLVAAIQFGGAHDQQLESPQLKQAVVDRAIATAAKLDFPHQVRLSLLCKRGIAAAVTVLLLTLAVWQFPDHATTFLRRLTLGTNRYPTRTRIDAIFIGDEPLAVFSTDDQTLRRPFGEAVVFEASLSGEIPNEGYVQWTPMVGLRDGETPEDGANASEDAERDRSAGTVRLLPAEDDPTRLVGRIEALGGPARCRFFVGDTSSDTIQLLVQPPPVVELTYEVILPDLGSAGPSPYRAVTGLRQITVPEGSSVAVGIHADRPLEAVSLHVDSHEYPLADTRDAVDWILSADKEPLVELVRPITFRIEATDRDGMHPREPIQGRIRIQPDQAPRIHAAALTRHVLPTARPTVSYQATDDHAVARVTLAVEVIRVSGPAEEIPEIVLFDLSESGQPAQNREGVHALDLASMRLNQGDDLKITAGAIDHRGPNRPGKTTTAEPLLFHVTDRQGLLKAMTESDRHTAEELQKMIQQQLDMDALK